MSPITDPVVHTLDPPGPVGSSADDGSARFRLSPLSTRPGRGMNAPGLLDGAWWPRTRDLTVEIPALIDALDPYWGRVTHISVNPAHWPTVPAKLPVGGRTVHVGWFMTQLDPNELLLLSYRAERWNLLVIPPDTTAAGAARLMAAAADPANVRGAHALMAAEESGGGPVLPAAVAA